MDLSVAQTCLFGGASSTAETAPTIIEMSIVNVQRERGTQILLSTCTTTSSRMNMMHYGMDRGYRGGLVDMGGDIQRNTLMVMP